MDLNKHKNIFWNKSIKNSLIAALWFLILSQIGISIWGLVTKIKFLDVYSKIFELLKANYFVRGWYLTLLYIIILGLIIWMILKLLKNNQYEKTKEPTDIELISEPELFEIREAPTPFFHYRFCDAFPGFSDGYKWFDSTRQIHKRLSTSFTKANFI